MDVSVFTQCYEKDYINVLSERRLNQMADLMRQPTNIIINSPEANPDQIEALCEERKSQGLISEYFKTGGPIAEQIEDAFRLTSESFSCSLHHRICLYNMAAIYFCPTDYLCFFTGDSIPVVVNNFLEKSIEQDKKSEKLHTYSLCWQEPITAGVTSSHEEDENFFYNQTAFSDQQYLINISKFDLGKMLQKPSSEGYPHSDAFESRMWQYMHSNGITRAIFKRGHYHHQNY